MLDRHDHADDIVELRLARPPVNALNPDLLGALCDSMDKAVADGARGIVLSGSPGIFTAGLDVPHLLTLERDALQAAWGRFFDACIALARSPVPVACAIGGHSPAGGAVLSLYCDYRVMAEGDFRIGLNEVQVGLIVPETIQYALRRLVGAHRAERMVVAGAMVDSAEARRIGLVDELAAVEQVVPAALRWLQGMLALPQSAMRETRQIARADLADSVDPSKLDLSAFIEAWYGEETQRVLHALVAKLKGKR